MTLRISEDVNVVRHWGTPTKQATYSRVTNGEIAPGADSLWQMLESTTVTCVLQGEEVDGRYCTSCERFRSFVPAPNDESATVMCEWSSSDAVAGIMSTAVCHVYGWQSALAADRVGRESGQHHVLVSCLGELVGIVCRCDLMRAEAGKPLVRDLMSSPVSAATDQATLSEAAFAMKRLCTTCLPVVRGLDVVGIVTADDLLNIGVPPAELFADRCPVCAKGDSVSPSPAGDGSRLCVHCASALLEDIDEEELGVGCD